LKGGLLAQTSPGVRFTGMSYWHTLHCAVQVSAPQTSASGSQQLVPAVAPPTQVHR